MDREADYGYTSRFLPVIKDVTGAKAIVVQDIPNGVIGRPVEFESKKYKVKMIHNFFLTFFLFTFHS